MITVRNRETKEHNGIARSIQNNRSITVNKCKIKELGGIVVVVVYHQSALYRHVKLGVSWKK